MPNRILRDWTDSLRFDELSPEAERLFVRLLMKADDYGRFHANPKLVRSACFPLAETLRANTVAAWLTEISDRQLVFCYTVGTGEYLAIANFGQRLKQSRAKFPPAPGMPGDWLPISDHFREVPGSSGKFPPESETETETNTESESSKPPIVSNGTSGAKQATPSLEEAKEAGRQMGVAADRVEIWWHEHESRPITPEGEWTDKSGRPVRNWRSALKAWDARWTSNAAQNKAQRPHKASANSGKGWQL